MARSDLSQGASFTLARFAPLPGHPTTRTSLPKPLPGKGLQSQVPAAALLLVVGWGHLPAAMNDADFPEVGSLFAKVPAQLAEELVEPLLEGSAFTLERIVSRGHITPAGQWYDQEREEWVMVVKGRARLLFERGAEVVEMEVGDYVHIPAHCRHRVEWTDPNQETIWLALHY